MNEALIASFDYFLVKFTANQQISEIRQTKKVDFFALVQFELLENKTLLFRSVSTEAPEVDLPLIVFGNKRIQIEIDLVLL